MRSIVSVLAALLSTNACFSDSFEFECGNSIREGVEECDRGENNSDTLPDACRTDCVLPACGDGVVDSDETCDEESATCIGCQRTLNCATNNPCFVTESCVDLAAGGVTCGDCPVGYEGDGVACTDLDQCAENPCSPGIECTDIAAPGTGFLCGDCPLGLEGDGVTCSEIDGCADDPCYPGVDCEDIPAPGLGFECGTCPVGLAGDGETCNECPNNATGDGVTCICDPGFYEDGGECDALLNAVALTVGTLSPAFSPTVTSYLVFLPTVDVAEVSLTPIVPSGVVPEINSVAVTPNVPSSPLALSLGTNVVPLRVSNGSSEQTYSLTFTRELPTPLDDPDNLAGSQYGSALGLDGDLLAIGARSEGGGSGAVYIFRRSNGTWSFDAKLKPDFPDTSDAFGISVEVTGNRVVVGSPGDGSSAPGIRATQPSDDNLSIAGAVYVYEHDGTEWELSAFLKPQFPVDSGAFGVRLDADATRVIVWAEQAQLSSGGPVQDGAAYVFVQESGSWSEEDVLRSTDIGPVEDVAVSGSRAAVSASDGGTNGAGSVVVYTFASGTWASSTVLTSESSDPLTVFGDSVELAPGLVSATSLRNQGVITFGSTSGWPELFRSETPANGLDIESDRVLLTTGQLFRDNGTAWQVTQLPLPTELSGSQPDSAAIDGITAVLGGAGRVFVFSLGN